MSNSVNTVYFSLDQGERASQQKIDQLLPQELYRQLAEKIKAALPVKKINLFDDDDWNQSDEEFFHKSRSHSAVLIEGDRGTGKSTVLVNLPMYLKEKCKDLARDVHVLKPVDPTQLEDADDIFLNVIVAAVLSDPELQKAQQRHESKRQELYRRLHDLGQALEGQQTQKKDIGLDKLRAFMGSHAIALAVHRFFEAALSLLGKNLLVLPIDDVDTTLHRAFENLEVVRRYLSTPLVLPLICGDLGLFNQVIWRDFYGRLSKDSQGEGKSDARIIAERLAAEYERKILPVQNRLKMPSVESYFDNYQIQLVDGDVSSPTVGVSLVDFHLWVLSIVVGTVNGLEKSSLKIPVPTVRALSQLLNRVRGLVRGLDFIGNARVEGVDDLFVRRILWMPKLNPAVMKNLVAARLDAVPEKKRGTGWMYATFAQEVKNHPKQETPLFHNHFIDDWHDALLDYFRYEPQGGVVYLILLACLHWKINLNRFSGNEVRSARSILATPLFQPVVHCERNDLENFQRKADISSWKDELGNRLPAALLKRLPDSAILPLATPEVGRAISGSEYLFWPGDKEKQDEKGKYFLILDLMLHRNYYSSSNQAPLILVGRVMELLVLSLIRKVSVEDVEYIIAQPPFHSAASVAPTKTMYFGVQPNSDVMAGVGRDALGERREFAVRDFVEKIEDWRRICGLDQVRVSPWLIYNVLNKVMNQAWFFNAPLSPNQQPRAHRGVDIVRCAQTAFNAFWAAVGGFEKGPLFGLSEVVATVNIGSGEAFENSVLYKQNISPFVSAESEKFGYGQLTGSITYVLKSHPLRDLFKVGHVFSDAASHGSAETQVMLDSQIRYAEAKSEQEKLARVKLFDVLGGENPKSKSLTIKAVVAALEQANVLPKQINDIKASLKKEYPLSQSVRSVLSRARNEFLRNLKQKNNANPSST